MTYKLYLTVKIIRLKNKFLNSTIGIWFEDFKEYGFIYGLRNMLTAPMSNGEFIKKMINYELRHYKGVDFNYIRNLPRIPTKPIRKNNISLDEFNKEWWDYTYRIYYMLDNIYNGYPIEIQDGWTNRYKFKTVKEYIKYEKYFYKMFPKTKIWKPEKKEIAENFSWFDLQYGLACDFDYEEIKKYKKNNKCKIWK